MIMHKNDEQQPPRHKIARHDCGPAYPIYQLFDPMADRHKHLAPLLLPALALNCRRPELTLLGNRAFTGAVQKQRRVARMFTNVCWSYGEISSIRLRIADGFVAHLLLGPY
jgi:hypothetical protein